MKQKLFRKLAVGSALAVGVIAVPLIATSCSSSSTTVDTYKSPVLPIDTTKTVGIESSEFTSKFTDAKDNLGKQKSYVKSYLKDPKSYDHITEMKLTSSTSDKANQWVSITITYYINSDKATGVQVLLFDQFKGSAKAYKIPTIEQATNSEVVKASDVAALKKLTWAQDGDKNSIGSGLGIGWILARDSYQNKISVLDTSGMQLKADDTKGTIVVTGLTYLTSDSSDVSGATVTLNTFTLTGFKIINPKK